MADFQVPPGVGPYDMGPRPEQLAQQRRALAVQLAAQSLHAKGEYSDDELIERARRIDLFVVSG